MSRVSVKDLENIVSRINKVSLNKVELTFAYGGIQAVYSISNSPVVPTAYTTKKEIYYVLLGMLAGIYCDRERDRYEILTN